MPQGHPITSGKAVVRHERKQGEEKQSGCDERERQRERESHRKIERSEDQKEINNLSLPIFRPSCSLSLSIHEVVLAT
jgi:hypothetical protein